MKHWYAIRHASEADLWWRFDRTNATEGWWTRDGEQASRLDSATAAGLWAARVGGEVVEVE